MHAPAVRYQYGRWPVAKSTTMPICPEHALPDHMYCGPHNAEALARLPDRATGDRAGLRWSSLTVTAKRRV